MLAAGVLAVATAAAQPTAVAKDGQQKSQTTCFFGPDGPPLSYPLDLVTT